VPTLRATLPELSEWCERGLNAQGHHKAAGAIAKAEIQSCHLAESSHAVVYLTAKGYGEQSGESVWVRRPEGARTRSWVVHVELAGNRPISISVSHPSVLRGALRRLASTLS
jgi:hypothetical protein